MAEVQMKTEQVQVKAQVDAINTIKTNEVNACKAAYGREAAEAAVRLKTTFSLPFRLRDWFGVEAKKDTEQAVMAGRKETHCIAEAETKAQVELAKLKQPQKK